MTSQGVSSCVAANSGATRWMLFDASPMISMLRVTASCTSSLFRKAILAHALSHAWVAGCCKMMLLTGKKDEATTRFHESAGFDGNEKRGFVAKPSPAADR